MDQTPAVRLRHLTGADRELLGRATLANVNWSGERFTAADVEATPELAHYLRLGPDDFGVVAEVESGEVAGVVWCRYSPADEPGYGFVSATVPELSIATFAEYRGHGIGRTLLDAAIDEAADRGCPGLSLSVEAGNWAQQLYRGSGFVTVGLNGNSDTMLLDLQGPGGTASDGDFAGDPADDEPTADEPRTADDPLEGEVL